MFGEDPHLYVWNAPLSAAELDASAERHAAGDAARDRRAVTTNCLDERFADGARPPAPPSPPAPPPRRPLPLPPPPHAPVLPPPPPLPLLSPAPDYPLSSPFRLPVRLLGT